MASVEDVTKILKKGIRFGAVGRVSPKHINQAAERLLNAGTVTLESLEQIGRELTGDRLLFNDVDIDQLQKVVERNRKPEVYAKSEDDI